MTVKDFNKTGSKYLRAIKGERDGHVDVYAIIETFDVRCPAVQHALKKLLCAGIRGKGDTLADLEEAKDAILRAIELELERKSYADWQKNFQADIATAIAQKFADKAATEPLFVPDDDTVRRLKETQAVPVQLQAAGFAPAEITFWNTLAPQVPTATEAIDGVNAFRAATAYKEPLPQPVCPPIVCDPEAGPATPLSDDPFDHF
jgi:hypothetical protein